MIFLWLSIFCSTGIYLVFKIRDRLKAGLASVIIINYFVATLSGIVTGNPAILFNTFPKAGWLPIAGLIGVLFVVMFFLTGVSTEKAGIAFTSLATRMSMVFPVSFSLFFFGEIITPSKILKIILTFIAVIMAIYHKPQKDIKAIYAFLPLILFIGSGSVDTLVKTAQYIFVPDSAIQFFSSVLFGTSFIASLFLLFIHKPGKSIFQKENLLLGSILGFLNFGSLYFFMKALNKSRLDSSLVFGINNLSIVSLSLIIGYFRYNEKLSRINWAGIILSVFCIILLTRF